MTGPQDPAAAGSDRLRAGHADREQVIEALKNAFVHGRLTKDELDTRAGQALAAQTYADLAALTADIPPAPARAAPPRPTAPAWRRPATSRRCADITTRSNSHRDGPWSKRAQASWPGPRRPTAGTSSALRAIRASRRTRAEP